MTTMIEKMARAMAADWHGEYWDTTADEGDGRDGSLFRNDFRDLARAALTALLEPSEGMAAAGAPLVNDVGGMYSDEEFREDARQIFTAAIQAALDEKEGV